MSEYFGILSPVLGLRDDMPSIFLKNADLTEGENFMFEDGLIERMRLRDKLFDPLLPNKILKYHMYQTRVTGTRYLMVMTKRDICYWDNANSRYAFVTPKYATGTASFVLGDKTVTFAGGANTANLTVGDLITIGLTYSSADTWYEVESITDATHVEVTVAYAAASSGAVAYQARQTYQGTDNNYWSCVTFEGSFYATNNTEVVQVWNASDQCIDITNLTDLCKFLDVFERHLMAIYIDSGGDPYPQRTRSCDLGDATNWTTGDATTFNIDSSYELTGSGVLQGFWYLFTEQDIYKVWYSGGTLIFNNDNLVRGLGCAAPASIVERDEAIYFFANDNTFRKLTGYSWESISDKISGITSDLHPTYKPYIQGMFIEQYNHIIWAVPSSASDGYLNTLLVYDLDAGVNQWSKSDCDVSALGWYLSETTYTWATLPFASWEDWNWPQWISRFEIAGAPYMLAGGYDGYTYRLYFTDTDAGSDYTSYFRIKTDLMQKTGLHIRKRVLGLQVFVKQRSGASMSIKCSEEDGGFLDVGAGSISLDDASEKEILRVLLPCDNSGNWFEYEFNTTNFFKFLGVIIEYDIIGER